MYMHAESLKCKITRAAVDAYLSPMQGTHNNEKIVMHNDFYAKCYVLHTAS